MPARKRTRHKFSQNVIALVYDFDGTLSPQPMQEYTVLPQITEKPVRFWAEVKRVNAKQKATEVLTYMRLMYEKLDKENQHVERKDLKALATKIKYFGGVPTWFDNINKYVRNISKRRAKVRHYVISSGLIEILEGTSIYKKLTNAFGSEYYFDHHGRATFVNRIITDSSKTQYLFRINKGREDLSQSVNDHMPPDKRPIPFKNIVYFGDGETDVPSMAVTREQGGHAIAVHQPNRGRKKCVELLDAKRIDFFAAADYRKNSDLWNKTTLLLRKIVSSIEYDHERFSEARRSERRRKRRKRRAR
jgi:hypothetical protein